MAKNKLTFHYSLSKEMTRPPKCKRGGGALSESKLLCPHCSARRCVYAKRSFAKLSPRIFPNLVVMKNLKVKPSLQFCHYNQNIIG